MLLSLFKRASGIKSSIQEENNSNEKNLHGKGTIMEENDFFKKIKKTNEFIKELQKLNLTKYITIPHICSIGTQSNGKSSILTNIIGLDILPKGDGVVTRRPLELRLNHIDSGEPYIYFSENEKDKITDFSNIKKMINDLTDASCGKNKNIKNDPLIINIFSQTCPDLTIIDLPGIAKVPVGNQPKNIEQITKDMTLNYINNPYTIILCALDANQDISTSDALYIAKQIDYFGERTIGVLTKVDLMDKGTDCGEILLNKLIPLKLGYIALKNRSKLDLAKKVSIKEGLENETSFFKNNEIYGKMDQNLFGINSLIKKLLEIYNKMFFKHIKDIIDSINQHIRRINRENELLGKPVPDDLFEKKIFIQNIIKNFCVTFFDILNNKNLNKYNDIIKNEERNKIKNLYENFLNEYFLNKPLEEDNSLVKKLEIHKKKIESESFFLYTIVTDYLFQLSRKVIYIKFKRFQKFETKIMKILLNILEKERENTNIFIEEILKAELNIDFTNDQKFFMKYGTENPIKSKNSQLNNEAVDEYIHIIARNVRNNIPKIIQYKLIYYLEKNLFNKLIEYIHKNTEILNELIESENYIQLRKDLNSKKLELEKLLKKIINSPETSEALLKIESKEERRHNLQILQKEKRDKLFKESLKKLKNIKNKDINSFRKEDIQATIESMCIIGRMEKENIIEEREKNPEKFIPINKAIKESKEDSPILCLGLLARTLEDQGITTAIEKDDENTEEEKVLSVTTIDFIVNGMIHKKKYDLHFDFGEERNEQLLCNEFEQKKFKDTVKKKICQKFGISEDTIILTDPQRGSFQLSLFESDKFQNLSLEKFKKEFYDDDLLCNLKEIQEKNILEGCRLKRKMLDSKGNQYDGGWGIGEKRGGYDYYPPLGWMGFGLKVLGVFKNDDWLDYNGNKNEWAVAYHGVGRNDSDPGKILLKIVKSKKLKAGDGQAYADYANDNKINNSKYKKVGKGVYCSPDPNVMNEYAGICQGYKIGVMFRVNPKKIRYSNYKSDYWVLNATTDEMRPYRILIKRPENS